MKDFDPNIQEGFGRVNIEKKELLAELKKNKEAHVKQYEHAAKLYKQTKIEYLNSLKEAIDARLNSVKPGDDVNTHFDLRITVSEPVSYEKQYDNAIRMLDLSTANSVLLGQNEFDQYVLDDWNWKQNWAANNLVIASGCYMAGELAKPFNGIGV